MPKSNLKVKFEPAKPRTLNAKYADAWCVVNGDGKRCVVVDVTERTELAPAQTRRLAEWLAAAAQWQARGKR